MIILSLFAGKLFAQNSIIYCEANIRSISRISKDSIQFELTLKRLTDDWHYFANSTFHLSFDTTLFKFDKSNLVLKLDSSGFAMGVLTGNNNPVGGYTFSEEIISNKIVIGFLGPETIEESQLLPLDQEYVIGRYTIYSTDNRGIPIDLNWINPTEYYQALAYKIEKDSLINEVTLYHKDDNLELHNGNSKITLFKQTYDVYKDTIILVDFIVKYIGKKNIELSWLTKEELNVVGFTIKRAFKYSDALTLNDNDYKVIYTWKKDSVKQFNPEMFSKGNTKIGFDYGILPDSVDYRGKEYCYRLYCNLYDSLRVPKTNEILLAEKCIEIPNAVIEVARIIKNDFPREIEMEYTISDDCLMTIAVYDLNGKEIEKLKDESGLEINKLPTKIGKHTLKFHPNPSISSGSYYVYLLAFPIEDKSVEISKAVIKLINLK